MYIGKPNNQPQMFQIVNKHYIATIVIIPRIFISYITILCNPIGHQYFRSAWCQDDKLSTENNPWLMHLIVEGTLHKSRLLWVGCQQIWEHRMLLLKHCWCLKNMPQYMLKIINKDIKLLQILGRNLQR